MNRPSSPLPRAAAGLFLLALSLLPAGSLSLGGPGAHAAVYFLLLALAGLALGLLFLSGLDRDRLLAALLPVGLALFLRALLLDYQSQDYQVFLSQWAAAFRDNGGFAAVKLPIGNYNAPYLYFLAAISYLPLPDLYLIKLFSVLFDVVLAWGGFRLVGQLCPGDRDRPLLCFCVLLLLPTAVANGAFWGQCDALYGALVVHALACALEKRPCASLALLGVAFSFKLQTVFVLPLWGALVLLGWAPLRALLCFPAAYAATCVPALLLGKPLGDILGVYVGQTQEGAGALNYNSPSLFGFFPYGAEPDEGFWAAVGIGLAFALVLAVLLALLVRRRRVSDAALLSAGAVLAIGVPFLLPYMHDRYLYLADVLTLAWAFALPRRAPVPVLVQLASCSAYLTYFRQKFTLILPLGGRLYTMLPEALLALTALVWAGLALGEELRAERGRT